MARTVYLKKRTFASGELDPKLIGRDDVKHYVSGANRMRNVFTLPQGGFRRRDGLQLIEKQLGQVARVTGQTITCTNGGTTANANDDDITTEVVTTAGVSTTNPYEVVHYDLGSAKTILFAAVMGLRLDTGSGVADEFFIQSSTDDIAWTSRGAAIPIDSLDENAQRRTSGTDGISARYWRVARIGSTDLSTSVVHLDEFSLFEDASLLSEQRLIDFKYSETDTYELLVTDRNAAVFKNKVHQVDFPVPYTSAEMEALSHTQSYDTLLLFHINHQTRNVLRIIDTDWDIAKQAFAYIPTYQYTPVEATPAGTLTPGDTTGQTKLTASVASFSAASVGQKVEGNGGLARIVQFNSTTEVVATIEIPFYNTDAIATGDWIYHTGYEDAWSDTRGWPSLGTFYKSRLYLAAGPLINRIWGSRIGFFFDFEPDQGLDDEPVEGAIDADEYNEIVALHPGAKLEIYTTGGVFTVEEKIITPNNFQFDAGVSRGAKKNLKVIPLDSSTAYIQQKGKAVREFSYDDLKQRYDAEPLSLLSSHLISDPVRFAKRHATSTEDADMLLLVNDDGTLATCSLMLSQEIVSWQLQTTQTDEAVSSFKDVGVDDQDVYCVVERTVNGSTDRYLETFNVDHLMDCSTKTTTGLPTDTFTIAELPSTTCQIESDGSVLIDATSDASGVFTIERDAVTDVEIGFDYPEYTDEFDVTYITPHVQLLPINPDMEEGVTSSRVKRIPEILLDLFETTGLLIQDERPPFTTFGTGAASPFDVAPVVYTGKKRIGGLLGYSRDGTVDITQDLPQQMTVISATLKVKI